MRTESVRSGWPSQDLTEEPCPEEPHPALLGTGYRSCAEYEACHDLELVQPKL